MKTEPNEFAYPMLDPNGQYAQYGLTKREHFAGLIAQGLLANYKPCDFTGGQVQMEASIIVTSVEMADAIIAQLNK